MQARDYGIPEQLSDAQIILIIKTQRMDNAGKSMISTLMGGLCMPLLINVTITKG
jgi:hypothetical protein